jgi:phosphate transport system protein
MPESTMNLQHTMKRFDEELGKLDASLSEMGGLAEAQLADALKALRERDTELAERVIRSDRRVDELEHNVQELVVQMLALRQPMANDLREIVTSLKMSVALERIADYAKNIAKRTLQLSSAQAPPRGISGVDRLGRIVQGLLRNVLDALASRDAAKARSVWEHDVEVDDAYNGLVRELLTYMMEDARTIGGCSQLMFMAKNIERIGDHATNIAELLIYRLTGTPVEEARPRGT